MIKVGDLAVIRVAPNDYLYEYNNRIVKVMLQQPHDGRYVIESEYNTANLNKAWFVNVCDLKDLVDYDTAIAESMLSCMMRVHEKAKEKDNGETK